MPLGFALALSQYPGEMDSFAKLGETERQNILSKAKGVNTKDEMQQLVKSVGDSQMYL